MEILRFPVEIQEKILSTLNGQTLYIASKVCTLWLDLCCRIARERYKKIVPSECLFETEQNWNLPFDEIWLETMNYHLLQQCFVNNMLDHKLSRKIKVKTNEQLCYCAYGSLIFVGQQCSEINVYNVESGSAGQPDAIYNLCSGPIIQLHVCELERLLIVVSAIDLQFWSLPSHTEKVWNFEMSRINETCDKYPDQVVSHVNLSISGNFLGIPTNPREVSMYKIKRKTDVVEVFFLTKYSTESSIISHSIWNDEVIILLASGEVIIWNLTTEKSTITEGYQEIRYQNPAWILRGRIFCSTIISSKMLGYWHMDRGASYWLIGCPQAELVRCRDLGTMFSADTNIEEVLCVCLKQRLLACGTKEGKILIYYLSDSFFSINRCEIDESDFLNDNMLVEFDRVPDLTIRTEERPIKDIQLTLDENKIFIFTWPFLTSSGPGSKGNVQCIVLSEGDWVTENDRNQINY